MYECDLAFNHINTYFNLNEQRYSIIENDTNPLYFVRDYFKMFYKIQNYSTIILLRTFLIGCVFGSINVFWCES